MNKGLIHNSGDIVGDRYEIECYVGAGGMQEVYKAKDTLLSRNVALKVPKNKSAEKRFQRSAIVSARINHVNVAKTLDYIECETGSYLIEEYILGKDLSRILKEDMRALDPMLAAYAFHHLARGLLASHHADVIHRDLKPSNVMAVGGPLLAEIKITDFGIAKMAEEEIAEAVEGGEGSLTASQTAIGALPYMAPEIIKSMKDAGKQSDVWSLGAMMFELISGEKPFGNGYKAIPVILEAKVPAIPNIMISKPQFKALGEQVYQLIAGCLRLNPGDRPTTVQLVQRCEQFCYPIAPREFGNISKFPNNYWGFIAPDAGKSVFFHVDSIYGPKVKLGDRIAFSRHSGDPNDRAFPVLKMLK